MKLCRRCNTLKGVDEFNKNSSRKDGLQTYCRECTKCIHDLRYKTSKEFRSRKNLKRGVSRLKLARFLRLYKVISSCKVCGESCHAALDFHHIDASTKSFNVSSNNSVSISTIKKEISKCVILCSNCHRKLHAGYIKLEGLPS